MPKDPFETLITSYNELNVPDIAELYSNPSPLDFMRYVAKNLPFVIRGGANDWPAVMNWNAKYLKNAMGDQTINVAVTPVGYVKSAVQVKCHQVDSNVGMQTRL